ncbi:MAG: S8 family serine peptidase [Nitrososphaerota archaeon]
MRRVIRGGECSELHRQAAAVAVIILVISVWATLNAIANPSPSLSSEEMRYVVNPKSVDKCIKVWEFGDTIICKTYQKHAISMGAKSWEMKSAFIPVVNYSVISTARVGSMFEPHGKPSFLGSGVVVAVVDTGIDYMHPAFEGAILEIWTVLYRSSSGGFLHWIMGVNGSIYDLAGLDHSLRMVSGEYAFADEAGHGTHVAGIIAGRPVSGFVGFAPGAKLFIVKAFLKNGTASSDMVLDALKIVYDSVERVGIKVVNLSWGALLNSDGSDPISVAAAKIAEKDVLVFAAAGNEGNLPFKILSPAVHKDVIALGAIDPETGKIAPFSSWGTTVDFRMKPDFVTAGVGIVSARSSFSNLPRWGGSGLLACASGTSMSAAVASGIGAVYAEYWMEMGDGRTLRESFLEFQRNMAERINPYYKDFVSGLGIIVAP